MKKIFLPVFVLILFAIIGYFSLMNYSNSNPVIFYHEITKNYYAPKSQIKINVNSKNYVEENTDLGNGNATVKLVKLNQKFDTIFLRTSPENIDFIIYQNKRIPFECNQMQPHNLFDFLKEKGFKNLDKNEIAELRDAMTLINYGPKATLLKGQTKFIEAFD